MRRTAFLLAASLAVHGSAFAQTPALPPMTLTAPAQAVMAAPARRGLTMDDLRAQFPRSESGAWRLEVPQLLNTATDPEVQTLLSGQPVEIVGQILADGAHWRLVRAEVLCCASHARSCAVTLRFPAAAPTVPEKAWVRLAGVVSYLGDQPVTVPVVTVHAIHAVEKPTAEVLK